jgi:hypothetical protein
MMLRARPWRRATSVTVTAGCIVSPMIWTLSWKLQRRRRSVLRTLIFIDLLALKLEHRTKKLGSSGPTLTSPGGLRHAHISEFQRKVFYKQGLIPPLMLNSQSPLADRKTMKRLIFLSRRTPIKRDV